jgi:hypothetical protein
MTVMASMARASLNITEFHHLSLSGLGLTYKVAAQGERSSISCIFPDSPTR